MNLPERLCLSYKRVICVHWWFNVICKTYLYPDRESVSVYMLLIFNLFTLFQALKGVGKV